MDDTIKDLEGRVSALEVEIQSAGRLEDVETVARFLEQAISQLDR